MPQGCQRATVQQLGSLLARLAPLACSLTALPALWTTGSPMHVLKLQSLPGQTRQAPVTLCCAHSTAALLMPLCYGAVLVAGTAGPTVGPQRKLERKSSLDLLVSYMPACVCLLTLTFLISSFTTHPAGIHAPNRQIVVVRVLHAWHLKLRQTAKAFLPDWMTELCPIHQLAQIVLYHELSLSWRIRCCAAVT